MRTFTKPQLAEFIKDKLGYDQGHSELVADILFEKARTKGAKDKKKRKTTLARISERRKFKIGKTPNGEIRYGPVPTKKWAWEK